ncbi:MAG: Mrp/NBP35 family ATP-binding protein [Candidatus Odinarchaeia archaeon]
MAESSSKTVNKEALKQEEKIKAQLKNIKHKIVVMSGKGGVGKSTFTVNLAVAFASKGYEVGILDGDLHGPCVPKMLGLEGAKPAVSPIGVLPLRGPLGIKVMSIEFFLPTSDQPVIWRGPLKMAALRQFFADVVWEKLDYLFIDLPPGTGDEPLSIMQMIPDLDGVIIVTAPSKVSALVVKKAINMAKKLNIPVIGVVENMSGFVCPNCGAKYDILGSGGGEEAAKDMNIPFLGKVPIDPSIAQNADLGLPFVLNNPDSIATKSFQQVVSKIETYIENHTA